MTVSLTDILPQDYADSRFLGRALSPAGPSVIALRDGTIFDLTETVATVSGAIARRVRRRQALGPIEAGLPEGGACSLPSICNA
jgi:fumarylacetoacetate (FAA) hydrolase family protein